MNGHCCGRWICHYLKAWVQTNDSQSDSIRTYTLDQGRNKQLQRYWTANESVTLLTVIAVTCESIQNTFHLISHQSSVIKTNTIFISHWSDIRTSTHTASFTPHQCQYSGQTLIKHSWNPQTTSQFKNEDIIIMLKIGLLINTKID